MTASLGTDLRVVLGPPGMVAHDTAFLDARLAPTLSPQREDVRDLAVIDGRHNLGQALMLRLLTPKGALAELGHGQYGSRLDELIGRPKDDTTRALCKTFVLEVVAQEPRVDDMAVSFAFDIEGEGPSEIRFNLVVKPKTDETPLALTLGVGL